RHSRRRGSRPLGGHGLPTPAARPRGGEPAVRGSDQADPAYVLGGPPRGAAPVRAGAPGGRGRPPAAGSCRPLDRRGRGRPAPGPEPGEGGASVRVHDVTGTLIGVGAITEDGRQVKPVRILHADRPGTRILPA